MEKNLNILKEKKKRFLYYDLLHHFNTHQSRLDSRREQKVCSETAFFSQHLGRYFILQGYLVQVK